MNEAMERGGIKPISQEKYNFLWGKKDERIIIDSAVV